MLKLNGKSIIWSNTRISMINPYISSYWIDSYRWITIDIHHVVFYCHWKSVTPEKFQVERKGGITTGTCTHHISFHLLLWYYKNKFLYTSPQVGVLTSYVIYLPTYLWFEYIIIEWGTPSCTHTWLPKCVWTYK